MEKLQWINAQYIKQKSSADLAKLLSPFLQEKGFIDQNYDSKKLENIVDLYKGRLATLTDFADWTDFLFQDHLAIAPELIEKHYIHQHKKEILLLKERLSGLNEFNAKSAEEVFRALVDELGIKAGGLVHPVRVALTGKEVGPGLFDTMGVLGKEKTIQRLAEAVNHP